MIETFALQEIADTLSQTVDSVSNMFAKALKRALLDMAENLDDRVIILESKVKDLERQIEILRSEIKYENYDW